jgi:proline iminopeptidase
MNPDEHTIAEHMLDVGHGHTLYIQDWGNKKAKKPIIFLHGGPGDGCKDKNKLPFDPKTQRVIFHDQRGAGKSTPLGHWHHNNTQELAADITKVADYLNINQFILTGNSWGSTLALYYAIQQPKRVSGLVIGAIWTCSKRELDWEKQGGYRTHFPEAWEALLSATPIAHHNDPLAFHFEQILGDDPAAAKQSAIVYATVAGRVMALDDNYSPINPTAFDPSATEINVRYMLKNCFLPDRFILKNASKLKMPVYIIHGRYDMLCPPETAYELHQSIAQSQLSWVIGGHRQEHEMITMKRLIYRQLTTGK